MTERTLREQIASLPRYESDEVGMDKCTEGNWLSRAEVLRLLDAHTAAQPAPDHTDLSWAREICDDPEKLDAFMQAHPLPPQPAPDAVAEAVDALGNIAAMGYSDDPAVQANIARMAVEMARSARSAFFKGQQP